MTLTLNSPRLRRNTTAPNPDDGEAWCPPIPEELTDPKGACRASEKLDTLVAQHRRTRRRISVPCNSCGLELWLGICGSSGVLFLFVFFIVV